MKMNDAGEHVGIPVETTLKQRGNRYGEFKNLAALSQELQDMFHTHVVNYGQPAEFTPVMTEAIEMIFHKIARIANGDPAYDDTWRDIAGYAQLVVDELDAND